MRLVLPARAISFFGDSLALVVLSLQVAKSDQPMLMTVLFIAFSLPLFALAPIAGRIVDEHDSRQLLVAAGAVQVIASLGLVWGPNFATIVVFVLLLQVGQSITGPTWAAVVPRIVGDALVGNAVGLQQSLSALAGLAGAAVGGVLFDVLGYHVTLLIDTTTFALLVVVGAAVRTRRGRRYDDRANSDADHTARDRDVRLTGRQYIFTDGLLKLLVPALWLFIVALEATNVVEIFLITDDLGASATVYGVTMAAMMLGQIVGPVLAGRIAADVRRVVWTGACAGALGVLVTTIGLSPSVWLVIPLTTVCGVAGGALNALIFTLVVTRSPEHMRGRVLATLNGTARGFSVLAMVLGGLSGQWLGARATFVVCGVLALLVAGLVVRSKAGLAEEQVLETVLVNESGDGSAASTTMAVPAP